jgi:hypothetical protein
MKRYFALGVLAACVAIAIVMWVLKPIPHAHRYDLCVQLTIPLALIWLLFQASTGWFFKKGILAVILVLGLGLGAWNLAAINPDSEIVRSYDSVFRAIDGGLNPYSSGTIFHLSESGNPVYGNFNYPPLEIYPYYLAYRLSGTWNSTVLTAVMILLNALCCLILLRMFPAIRPGYLMAFFPLFLFGEIKTNPSMTLLVTALILWLIKRDREKPGKATSYLIAVLFGVGLMTKFLVIPFMAAYYWHKFDPKKLRSLASIALDCGIALATAVMIMAPFGVAAVFRNTVLFNLVLKDRAALTTFYPNVLSGPLNWLGMGGLYPVAAVIILGLSILAAPRLRLFSAMLAAGTTFLLVAPTPEPQFLPTVLFLVVTARCLAIEEERPVLPHIWKRPPPAAAGTAA